MVYHEQSSNINDELVHFEKQLEDIGFTDRCIHSGPIIRSEEDYRNIDISTRKSIFKKTAAFVRNLDIKYKSFHIEKKHIKNDVEAAGKLSKQISAFLKEHNTYFLSFDKIIVYYDNGQTQLIKY